MVSGGFRLQQVRRGHASPPVCTMFARATVVLVYHTAYSLWRTLSAPLRKIGMRSPPKVVKSEKPLLDHGLPREPWTIITNSFPGALSKM